MSIPLHMQMGGCQVSTGQVDSNVAEIDLGTQPSDGECQIPHCIVSIVWSCGARSRGTESWGAGTLSLS